MKKIGAYTWALIVLIFVFLTTGLFTLGSTKSTGESVQLKAGDTAYFTLNLESGDKLASVHVNVGEVYVETGKTATVTVKTSDSSSPSTATTNWSTFGVEKELAAIALGASGEVTHFNWVEFTRDTAKSAKKVYIRTSAPIRLNEVVCLNQDGERIAITVYNPSSNTYSNTRVKELASAFDAQDSFTQSADAYYNFTREESNYMVSVMNLLSGNELNEGNVYHLDKEFNYLALAMMAGSVGVFGTSVFALRLPALLSACCILVFAFLLLKELTKSEKTAFIFSVLLAVGGVLVTVGKFGAPYMMVASAVVASGYFMYRFFSKGIANDLKGGENVLLSGIFGALAMAMDTTALIPVLAILVLFGFGLRRQYVAYQRALAKTEGMGESSVNAQGETVTVNKAAEKVKFNYDEKTRLSVGFAVIGFAIVTVLLLLLGGVLAFSAYVRANNAANVNILKILWDGALYSSRGVFNPSLTKASAASVFSWFLPWKAATLYVGDAAVGSYAVWSVVPNVILTVLNLIAFVFMTVKVVLGFVQKNESKESLRVRRTYFVLLGGLVAALVMSLLNADACVITSTIFQVCYVGFTALALHTLENDENGKESCKKLWSVLAWVVVGLCVAAFVFTLPALYGFTVPSGWARAFAWTSFTSNGFFN